jgi:hypothetical protein
MVAVPPGGSAQWTFPSLEFLHLLIPFFRIFFPAIFRFPYIFQYKTFPLQNLYPLFKAFFSTLIAFTLTFLSSLFTSVLFPPFPGPFSVFFPPEFS